MGDCAVVVELILAGNQLSGSVPSDLARLTNLTTLDLSCNSLAGEIPSRLGDAHRLQGLNLAYNNFTGSIPAELGNIASLVKLNLTGNRLSGSIPESLGNLSSLSHLDVSSNQLTGNIPGSLAQLVAVVGLNLQQNRLTGTIAALLSKSLIWHQMQTLNVSNNLLVGQVPRIIGNLTGLSYLDLSHNVFNGSIPGEIGNLMQLIYLDLSSNDITGEIPLELCDLFELEFLNMSNNSLQGSIPTSGICGNFSATSFLLNAGLCGSVINITCNVHYEDGSAASLSIGAISGIAIGSVMAVVSVMALVLRWRMQRHDALIARTAETTKLNVNLEPSIFLAPSKMKEPLSINVAMFERPLLRLTLADILQATNSFCKTNIIGDGGFGTVYKAVLPDGRTVAIKKLGQARTQGNREFLAEMETLGKVKHRNLVPLLGYCSFGEEKLLVYEYMVNGSLDLWLRNRADALETLDWPKRFRIAMGSARGLAFLHHGFIPHIIHRDMKASNILLDDDFEPRVADFGLARLISAYDTHVSTDIAGTFGYIPPEYGQTWRSTTRGDVYSYGVILLELVTGKEPTGVDFKEIEGGNLVGWVRQKIKRGLAVETLDPVICNGSPWRKRMLDVLKVANLCTCEDPVQRPTMLVVVKILKDIEANHP
jgi:Leucine-rich repeat (LRR) protein